MTRLVAILAGGLIGLTLLVILLLGAFPPRPHASAVEHTIPNTQFK